MTVVGLGLDVVDVAAFRTQLEDRASGFVEAVYTAGERRRLPVDGARRVLSLAGRFAAKEAFVKAWSATRRGFPPGVPEPPWQEIEVVDDGFGRPGLRLHGGVAAAGAALAGTGVLTVHVSVSHDGPVAAAVVVLEVTEPVRDQGHTAAG